MTGHWRTCLGRGLRALLAVAILVASPARGATPAELQQQAQQAAADRARALREGALDAAAEGRLIARLGQLALAFIDLSDRVARAGAERGDGLKPAFEAIYEPLHAVYAGRNDFLERRSRAVMEADGDLEALYETRDWREAQTLAAQALYYLNWLSFYGARLCDGARRRELLESAERGFSEFVTGAPRKDLLTESTLGRGLCHLELGNTEWAVRDFKAVLDEPTTSRERKEKARLALLDAFGRGGKRKEALRYSQELLADDALDPADAAAVRFVRLQTLFDAMKEAAPADAERYRREVGPLMDAVRRSGKAWADKVDALLITRVDNPAQWIGKVDTPAAKFELAKLFLQKNDDAHAIPLIEELAESADGAARAFRSEANYLLGVARFKAGDYPAAATRFDVALAAPQPAFAADAAYLRFKALEAQMAKQATESLAARYVAALRDLLDRHPEHAQAAEARYRLGEYLQGQGDFAGAIDAYARVSGDPGFEFRSRFGTLQSEFEQLKSPLDPPARAALLARIGDELDALETAARGIDQSKDRGDLPLAEFRAKATVMRAVYLSLRSSDAAPEMLEVLNGFEQHYPSQRDLFAQVARLRLGAYQRLDRFVDAAREVSARGAVLRADAKSEPLEKLAAGFAKAAARVKAAGKTEDADAAERVALALYELLDAQGDVSADKTKLTMGRLYESRDDFERAEAVYREVLEQRPDSLAALRGLAHVMEGRRDAAAAFDYWKRYTAATRPGDPSWYEGHYEQARLALARGDRKSACAILERLKPAMAGLGDADRRRQLVDLYKQVCS